MTARYLRWLLAGIFLVGLATRLIAWRYGPPLYPDAYFQYLEPAWGRISGVGLQAHEWREGYRSWAQPAYNGAWMALLNFLGVKGNVIGEFIKLHWGIISLAMVWAAWRGGCSMARMIHRRSVDSGIATTQFGVVFGWQGGLLAAFLVAAFPLLALYSIEPLSELPSMIGVVCGLCLTAELVEQGELAPQSTAALVGFLLSLAVCLRSVNAPIALLAPYWLHQCGSRRLLRPMALAALLPLAVFGVLDRITWGGYFYTYIKHLKFNIVDGSAVQYGSEPLDWYLKKVMGRLPIGIPLLLAPALLAGRVTWPFILAAAGFFVAASSQGHKEERFIIVIWPMLLLAAGASAGGWLMTNVPREAANSSRFCQLRVKAATVLRSLVVLGGAVFVIHEGFTHMGHHEFGLTRARFEAETWIGNDPQLTGMLVDWSPYTGAYLWFNRTLPFVKFERHLLANPLFSHVMTTIGSSDAHNAQEAGFVPVFARDNIVVLRRDPVKAMQ